MPFHRLKVRLKKEIVTMGVPGLDPARRAGTRLDAAAWNALLDDPETIVLDTRNGYEVALGSFRGAIDPQTASFRDFPAWLAAPTRSGSPDARWRCSAPAASAARRPPPMRAPVGLDAGLPPRRRHPALFGGGRACGEPMAGRMLRVRRARLGRSRAGSRRGYALPRLPAAADGRRPQFAALPGGHLLRGLPRPAQRRGPRALRNAIGRWRWRPHAAARHVGR